MFGLLPDINLSRMAAQLDIVKLIEKNPITRLSQDYQSKLLNKIKDKFTDGQQQLFVTSFYCYLNHNAKNEFIIDLDDVWKWLGFSRKDPAKVVLDKNFIKDLDYKITLPLKEEQNKKSKGGRNKEQILMTINTYKRFCLKANTKKSDEIHNYYILFEELLQETINEETDELRKQLIIKEELLEKNKHDNELQMKINKHKLFLEKFKSKRCVYIAEIKEKKYIKIGSTKDINNRIKQLQKLYNGIPIYFIDVFDCDNFREVEDAILNDQLFIKNACKEYIEGHKSREVVTLTDTFTYDQFYDVVKLYINKVFFMNPTQIIEREKIELEKKKEDMEFLKTMMNNPNYIDIIKDILKDKLTFALDNITN